MNLIQTPPQLDRLPLSALREVFAHSMIWDRGGEKRLIPAGVIRNAKELRDSWRCLVQIGVIESVPDQYESIPWEAALVIPQGSSRVTVSTDSKSG